MGWTEGGEGRTGKRPLWTERVFTDWSEKNGANKSTRMSRLSVIEVGLPLAGAHSLSVTLTFTSFRILLFAVSFFPPPCRRRRVSQPLLPLKYRCAPGEGVEGAIVRLRVTARILMRRDSALNLG